MKHRFERTLISLSSSITTFRTPKYEHYSILTDQDMYNEWYNTTGSDILYVHGGADMRETSEQLFYNLDEQAQTLGKKRRIATLTLYFSFDKHDATRNTLKNMLSTFIAQIICHHANRMSSYGDGMFKQIKEEHGWTDRDLLQWFDSHRANLMAGFICLVIDGFDDCPEDGRKPFLDWLAWTMSSCEVPLKSAITSRKPGALSQELHKWKCIDLGSTTRQNLAAEPDYAMEQKYQLIRHRPELLDTDGLLQSIQTVCGADLLAREIQLAQAISQPDWPQKISLEAIFGVEETENCGDGLLAKVLDSSLRRLQKDCQVRIMLTWLLYSARPMSVWEFTSVMYPDSLDDLNASPTPEAVHIFIQMCQNWLGGIVEIRDQLVQLRHPRLRDILTSPSPVEDPQYLWSGLDTAEAAFETTKACLEFLARPNVQRKMAEMIEIATLDEKTHWPVPDPTNFCSYAAYYWPTHYALIANIQEPASLLKKYRQSSMTSTWAKAHWTLDNRATRSEQPCDSVDALFATLGLPTPPFEDWDANSLHYAMCGAARLGRHEVVKTLLHHCEQSRSILMDALMAAMSSGEEKLILHVFRHFKEAVRIEDEKVEWPPRLLSRAAWLGLSKFTEMLLEAGCPPEPDDSVTTKISWSPLHLATRYGHIATVDVLLSKGADASLVTSSDRTVLFIATHQGRPEMFKLLFDKGKVDMTKTDEFKATPLQHAAKWGLSAAVRCLLRLGADPHDGQVLISPDLGWLPLTSAASRGHSECVRFLLESDADPNQAGPFGKQSVLGYAAVFNYPATCRVLLENGADPNHPRLNPPLLAEIVGPNRGGPLITPADKLGLLNLLVEFGALVNAVNDTGQTVLMQAIRSGDESLVSRLLELGAKVDLYDNEKEGPLHYAALQGSEPILDLILAENPDLDCRNRFGASPLYLAVKFPNLLQKLLEKGANPNLPLYDDFTPLMRATDLKSRESAKLLLEHGAEVNAAIGPGEESVGWTAVAYAADLDDEGLLQLLVDAGANLSHKTEKGFTPIHMVSKPESARVLLQHRKRFDIDEPDKGGETPLTNAIWDSCPTELIKLFIDNGANLNAQAEDGTTPLWAAARENDHKTVKLLLQEGECELALERLPWGSPLHAAARYSDIEMVKLFVEGGADVHRTGAGLGGTPLQMACENRGMGKDIVEYFLDRGVELDTQAGMLGFPISSAAAWGSPEVIRILLERGVTTNVTDAMGRVPIHLACRGGHEQFQDIWRAGGKYNIKDQDKMQRTVFHWAAQHMAPGTLEDLIAAVGNEVSQMINEPDIDGWTPLLWACRPGERGTEDEEEQEKRQKAIIRMLLDNGASLQVAGTIGIPTDVWSLRKAAVYSGMGRDVLKLLEIDSGPSGEEATEIFRVGDAKSELWCDACYWVSTLDRPIFPAFPIPPSTSLQYRLRLISTHAVSVQSIRGFAHACVTCHMDLCTKCHWHRALVHDGLCEGTEWEQNGKEFEEEKESSTSSDQSENEAGKNMGESDDLESSLNDSDSGSEQS